MAKIGRNKKFLTLGKVNVLYNAEYDEVYLTAKDKGFDPGDRFHMTLNKATATEKTLRKLLQKHGMIPKDVVKPIPRLLPISDRDTANDRWGVLPLGVTRESEIAWNVERPALNNLLLAGDPNDTHVTAHLLKSYAQQWDTYWEIQSIDIPTVFSSNYFQELREIDEELYALRRQCEELTNDDSGNRDMKRKLVFISDYASIFGYVAASNYTVEEYNHIVYHQKRMQESIQYLIAYGYESGMHCVVTISTPPPENPSRFFMYFKTKMVFGKMYERFLEQVPPQLAPVLPDIPGRGVIAFEYRQPIEIQAYNDL